MSLICHTLRLSKSNSVIAEHLITAQSYKFLNRSLNLMHGCCAIGGQFARGIVLGLLHLKSLTRSGQRRGRCKRRGIRRARPCRIAVHLCGTVPWPCAFSVIGGGLRFRLVYRLSLTQEFAERCVPLKLGLVKNARRSRALNVPYFFFFFLDSNHSSKVMVLSR